MDLESKSVALAEDRISALPDAVLSRIISCIDPKLTKCAVRTSILSKRWKNMWASVPNLYFDNHDFSSPADFIAFVDHALQIRDPLAIGKFGISFSRFEHHDEALSHIDDWISTVARCHVLVLALCVNTDGDKIFDLPKSLFSCKTLTALKLGVNFIINIPTSECFPRLKELHLTFDKPRVVCPAYDSIDFSYFRVLEHLTIHGSLGYGGFNFNISLSELKFLRIKLFPGHGHDAVYRFHINAPKLETLDVSEGLLSDYTFENTNSLVEANIKVIYDNFEQAASADLTTKLLEGISGVKRLYLQSPISKLKLSLIAIYFEWSTLITLLEGSPSLECLILEHENCPLPCTGELLLPIRLNVAGYPFLQPWSPPESVPNCLLSHLKTICIKAFQGKEFAGYLDEIEVTKYMLKNGQVLENITIYTSGFSTDAEEKLNEEFSMFERGSGTCRVELIKEELYFYRS